MSVNNTAISRQLPSPSAKRPKDRFSYLQAGLILILTLVISLGGWYAAGKYYFWSDLDKKRISEQMVYFQQKVQAEPKNVDHRVSLAYTYFLLDKNDQAIRELNQAMEIDKNNFDVYYNLGLVYSDEARLDDAMEMFKKCVDISPRDYKGHMQMGIVYRKLEMYKDGLKALEKADKLKPGSADIIYEIGRVAEEKGDKKLAIDIYKDALKFDPLFKDAAKALERLQ